jgi:fermentation-respiration switch protein FrsA (DUF1100 family)
MSKFYDTLQQKLTSKLFTTITYIAIVLIGVTVIIVHRMAESSNRSELSMDVDAWIGQQLKFNQMWDFLLLMV